MIFGSNGNTRMKTLAGALVLSFAAVASAAHAGTTLVGGGATLPALGYGGDATHRQITPTTGSFLYVYSAQTGNPQTSYCQTGSGAGKNILAGGTIGGTSYNVQNACPDGSATPTGFGAAAVGRSDLTQPNFAGADSPLSASDYTNYRNNRPSSYPVEFPAVAGAIAIGFNKAGVSSLNLTDAQVCQIFSGQITNWNQISSVTGPINVVYRSDGSGTTFGFSNHLSAACSGTASAHFVTDQAFTNVVAKYQPTLPSNWVGQSGNPNVANYVVANDGTIAYVEADNAANVLGSFATVNGQDPIANFGASPLPISSSAINYNYVINGADPTTGRPIMSAISGAPSTQCIALVDPSSYAKPVSGYPIVAVSYLLANSANNGSDQTAVQNLMWAPYNSTITSNTTQIGSGTGLSFLSTSFTQSAVQGCVGT
ncbi:substrate-binding domain-containing protein [Dyella terrae]|nr:substrate-binding domain-containing protein [Dyella terrae]